MAKVHYRKKFMVHRRAEKLRQERTTPTPGETARFHALVPFVFCWNCQHMRFAFYIRSDGSCAWCHGEAPCDAQLQDDREFIAHFIQRYLHDEPR